MSERKWIVPVVWKTREELAQMYGDENGVVCSQANDPSSFDVVDYRVVEPETIPAERLPPAMIPAFWMPSPFRLSAKAPLTPLPTRLLIDTAAPLVMVPDIVAPLLTVSPMPPAAAVVLLTVSPPVPVINPFEALAVIETCKDVVDAWKIGKWNHDARANAIDWAAFLRDARALLYGIGKPYIIKDDLLKAAGG